MIAFLTVATAVVFLAMLASGFTRIGERRPADPIGVGPWGLWKRTVEPYRDLSAEERRWQTLLTRAEGDEGTWRDVQDRLSQLERTLGGQPPNTTSANFDRSQLHATIARLEALTVSESEKR